MRIGRTLPPAAAPLRAGDLWRGLAGALSPERALRALEEDLRRFFGVGHVFLVSSGTAALTLALMALKSRSLRREVVMPAYTCYSVAAAVLKAGLRPALCDIDPSSFDFDAGRLEETLNADTLCVVAHHLFGIPSDVERTRALAGARGALVVEDAAQAMGVDADGRWLGTLGDVGVFSLGRGKNVTCGSGGVIVTGSHEIAEAVERQCRRLEPPTRLEALKELVQVALMAVFIRPRLYWLPAALPFLRLGETVFPRHVPLKRLSGMKAGLLRNWRSRLAESNRVRSETAAYFGRRLSLAPARRSAHPYLRLPVFAATAEDKARVLSLSRARGLGLGVAYPRAIHEIPEMRAVVDGRRFPLARSVAERLLTIPTHHWLSESDKRAIADVCRGLAPS